MARSNRFAERNAFVEASLEGAVDLLRNVEPVQELLGVYATQLADILENDLFVAPVRSGDYHFPKNRLQTNAMPAFSLLPGEHIEVIGAGLTPTQIDNVSKTKIEATSGFSPDLMHQIATAYSSGASTSRGGRMDFSTSNAFVSSREDRIPLAEGRKALILGRPVMAMLFEKGKKRISPDIIVHEGAHIIQRLTSPLREVGEKPEALRNTASELEAYRNQALFVQGLIEYGYKPSPEESGNNGGSSWTHSMEIERLRSLYADPELPYVLNRKMKRKMKRYSGSLKVR